MDAAPRTAVYLCLWIIGGKLINTAFLSKIQTADLKLVLIIFI